MWGPGWGPWERDRVHGGGLSGPSVQAEVSRGDIVPCPPPPEPRPARPAVSSDEDEETAEQPKSRRVRASPAGRGIKVPLFPGLSAAALKVRTLGHPS